MSSLATRTCIHGIQAYYLLHQIMESLHMSGIHSHPPTHPRTKEGTEVIDTELCIELEGSRLHFAKCANMLRARCQARVFRAVCVCGSERRHASEDARGHTERACVRACTQVSDRDGERQLNVYSPCATPPSA